MRGSGKQVGFGNLSEIKKDINDVVNDLQRKSSIKKRKISKGEFYREC